VRHGAVLGVGDRVRISGEEHAVSAVSIDGAQLRSASGTRIDLSRADLIISDEVELPDAQARSCVEPREDSERPPPEALERARWWEKHVIELETGRHPDADPVSPPDPRYDPARTTVTERDEAKAAQLTGAGSPTSSATVQRMRLRYRRDGVAGLIDQRSIRERHAFGTADPRLVESIKEALALQPDARRGAMRDRVVRGMEERYGAGAVPIPSRATFNRLINAARTIDLVPVESPLPGFTGPLYAHEEPDQPLGLVSLTSLDAYARAIDEDGAIFQVGITIAVDAATHLILAALVHRAGSTSIDTAGVLARVLVPPELRPPAPHKAGRAATPFVFPTTMHLDQNGPEASAAFLADCERLGIGVIERGQSREQDRLLRLALYAAYAMRVSFDDEVDRLVTPPGEPRVQALLDIKSLQIILDAWLAEKWHNTPASFLEPSTPEGRRISPLGAYRRSIERARSIVLPLGPEQYIELLPRCFRPVNGPGVLRIDGHQYQVYDALTPEERVKIMDAGGRWEVRYDCFDRSKVWARYQDSAWMPATPAAAAADPTHIAIHSAEHVRTLIDQASSRGSWLAEGALAPAPRRPRTTLTAASITAAADAGQPPAPLGSREGWRSFVRSEDTRLSRHADEHKRVAYHARLPMVETGFTTSVAQAAGRLIALNARERVMRHALVVSGPTASGKTAAITDFARGYELAVLGRSAPRSPVVYLSVPPAASAKLLAAELARALGVAISRRHALPDVVDAVRAALAREGCSLILLDDVHRLAQGHPGSVEVGEHLRSLTSALPVTLVFCGTAMQQAALLRGGGGTQFAAHSTWVTAAPLPRHAEKGQVDFPALVRVFESSFRLRRHRLGQLDALCDLLFDLTEGHVGRLAPLLSAAAVHAIVSGSEQVTAREVTAAAPSPA
jgi:hypothetical protein